MTTKKKRAGQDAHPGARGPLRAADWGQLGTLERAMIAGMLALAVQLAVAESELPQEGGT